MVLLLRNGLVMFALLQPHLHVITFLLSAAMHDTDPVFKKWSRSAQAAELLEDLGYKRALPVQSMYIFKVCRALLCHHVGC